ncbi:hypothetical protein AYI68_g952 [Smittium mucronatum]|uniref:Transmembrane protein n=1 Tax=Smittium mucronatum TaxID=133383 RepID=A0A1R0H6R4_9FUNG|nr:hypothetical protein AYI68_g952 [Smittium mucronatum]
MAAISPIRMVEAGSEEDECFRRQCYSDYTNTLCVASCYNVPNPSYETVVKTFNCYNQCQSQFAQSSDDDNYSFQSDAFYRMKSCVLGCNQIYTTDKNVNGGGPNGFIVYPLPSKTPLSGYEAAGYTVSVPVHTKTTLTTTIRPNYYTTTMASGHSQLSSRSQSTNYNFFEWYTGLATLTQAIDNNPFYSGNSDLNSLYSTQTSAATTITSTTALGLFVVLMSALLSLAVIF